MERAGVCRGNLHERPLVKGISPSQISPGCGIVVVTLVAEGVTVPGDSGIRDVAIEPQDELPL